MESTTENYGPDTDGQTFANDGSDVRDTQFENASGIEALDVLKTDRKPTPEQVRDATEWFMSDEDTGPAFKSFEINVSADPDVDKFVRWKVKSISRERIRQFRRQSRVKANRVTEDIDETKVTLLIAVEGTVEPNLNVLAQQIGTDPPTLLKQRFAHKPGLIDQIAAEVQGVSGYDDDDVRDVLAGKG